MEKKNYTSANSEHTVILHSSNFAIITKNKILFEMYNPHVSTWKNVKSTSTLEIKKYASSTTHKSSMVFDIPLVVLHFQPEILKFPWPK